MVAKFEVATWRDCDLGDSADECRKQCSVRAVSTACKSLRRVNCELAGSDLKYSFLRGRGSDRTVGLNAKSIMIQERPDSCGRKVGVGDQRCFANVILVVFCA